jgi:release factor glutamine methyltransferase
MIRSPLKAGGIDEFEEETRIIAEFIYETDYSRIIAGLAGGPYFDQVEKASSIVERRLRGEPLAHILGFAWFYGHRFNIASGVLVPRPETEVLVEESLELLNNIKLLKPKILDLYTGCGNVILSIASERKNITGLGVDVDTAAIDCAINNRNDLGCKAIEFRVMPVAEILDISQKEYYLVTANPPYIRSEEISALQPEIAQHENHVALDGGPDGLEQYRILADKVKHALSPNGFFLCEIGAGQKDAISDIFSDWRDVSFVNDLNHIPRVLKARP